MLYKIFSKILEDEAHYISLKKNSKNDFLAEFTIESTVNTYKGSFGKTLILGGSDGYLGAVLISGISALRSGSRYVEIFSTERHLSLISTYQPELISSSVFDGLEEKFESYRNLLLGPGMANDKWSKKIFLLFKDFILNNKFDKNIVVDAGFLNLLSKDPFKYDNWILTPHIGEAANLLNTSKENIIKNKIDSAKQIQKIYGGIIIIKGHETIIQTETQTFICGHGNSSMGTAGMGDCLAGIIISLISLVNKKDYNNAVLYAVAAHSLAADNVLSSQGGIGILASDVIVEINKLLND